MKKSILPELLAPAGSSLAFDAAIDGGADAIYVGGLAFNARINAKNFTPDELREAIARAHAYGVKVYVAANTMIFDRELDGYLKAAEQAYLFGADALIVADIGAAREVSRRIPIELHASTQMAGHNVAAAEILHKTGFSRMVLAREMSRDDIAHFCKNSPIEAEVFVHGALCVCHSGQCLFSSVVGGRSGNRGECAQPCRLPYGRGKKESYPLSLKDLSLAEHLRELCDMGVASLKIEGRMKSPEYVRDVTRIWRTLLDEGRDASPEDMRELAKIFSRGGFTDGYYRKKITSNMLGVRSEEDKRESGLLAPFSSIERKISIDFFASIKRGERTSLTARLGDREVCVRGDMPSDAINAPLTRDTVVRNISKLGATPYKLARLELDLDEGLMLPISSLNALRRAAIDAIAPENTRTHKDMILPDGMLVPERNKQKNEVRRSALFYDPSAIPDEAEGFFEQIFVPLENYEKAWKKANGVMVPEVIFDSELKEVDEMLKKAKELGAKYALVGNIGHIALAQKYGFILWGDIRLNVANPASSATFEGLGLEELIVSPEMSLAQQRDMLGKVRSVVYGRLPLMINEKCVGKELGGCESCKNRQTSLRDRRGVEFPVRRRYPHRSVIFNSVPIYMGDRESELRSAGIYARHFIFSVESKEESAKIIADHISKSTVKSMSFRRIR